MNKKVVVLMSTYNGEKYLKEQIDSIMFQQDVDVDLLIRDDGSIDNTIKILEEYQKKYSNIEFYQGENLGPAKSFMDLIKKVEIKYDYYSFADQDDVWDKRKIISGIEKIEEVENNKNIPILQFCEAEIVDENLNKIGKISEDIVLSNSLKDVAYRLRGILGCTMIMNSKLLLECRKYIPQKISMHDKWIHLVCLYVGGIVVKNNNSYIKYRRIPNKSVTGKKSILKRIKKLLELFKSDKKCLYSEQICELIDNIDCRISDSDIEMCNLIKKYRFNISCKIKLLLANNPFIPKRELLNLKLRVFLRIF